MSVSATSQRLTPGSMPDFPMAPAGSLSELRQRATVDPSGSEKYTVQQWILVVSQLYQQGDWACRHDDMDNAYVCYMRGCSVMVEIISKHPNKHEAFSDPLYSQLKQRTDNEIFGSLETIAIRLERRFGNSSNVTSKSPMNLTPSVSSPSRTSARTRTSPIPSIPLPSPTNAVFADSLIVCVDELVSWITQKENAPSVLLLDVRPRHVFEGGCIKHQWIVQVDPRVLKMGIEAHIIQKYLSSNPKAEQNLFTERDRFDVIVYYDQNAQSIPMAGEAMRSIKSALYELERQKPLRRAPMMLAGGFDTWQSVVGERGIFRFPNTHGKEKVNGFTNASLAARPHYEYACIRKPTTYIEVDSNQGET
ncbi:ubiquitin-specific protease doa4 [Apophysomyces ossiformis]|uniref:Ubiquitin-specific protease doa4 n=1 Tax=Apophysomyces ossiformis TaxID=679940 RepID=A0A8H7BG93_9FUNG|nr:ubiquitin-specific protease doa4 [Apophysomyces ossiformis]